MANTRLDSSGQIRRTYSKHIENAGGIFTPATRRRLISLAEEPKSGARENDFWYDVRTHVRNALTDLAMIAEIASEEQLKKMFSQLSKEDFEDDKMTEAKRADLKMFLAALLYSSGKTVIDEKEKWRYRIAVDIADVALRYFPQKRGYDTITHQRMIAEILDAIKVRYGD